MYYYGVFGFLDSSGKRIFNFNGTRILRKVRVEIVFCSEVELWTFKTVTVIMDSVKNMYTKRLYRTVKFF